MWRLLCLLLAFVAPAQAAIHCDGFEASMPVTDWVQVLGLKDGVSDLDVAISHVGESEVNLDISDIPFSGSEFPTTPSVVVGYEIRIAASSSHSGVRVSGIQHTTLFLQASGTEETLVIGGSSNSTSPQFSTDDIGDSEYIAAGGYMAIISNPLIDMNSPVALEASIDAMADPDWWSRGQYDADGEPLSPYERSYDRLKIRFVSEDGFDATLSIDAIEMRLHYEDASTTSMSGGGTMSATLLKAKAITTAMTGSGTCAATLNAKRNIYSDMRGSGKITPVISRDSGGTIYRYLRPEMIGTGVVTLTQPIRYGTIRSNMVGSGNVVASISHGKNIMAPSRNGTLALRGSGTLAGSLRAKRPIATAMTGSGTISGGPLAKRPIATAMTGTGNVSASMIATRPIATAMTGSGVMSETLQAGRVHPGVAMTGSGAMTVALLAKRPLVAAMQGTGLLSADLTINTRLSAPDGRTFIVPESDATFIAPDDFIAFEATE